MNKIRVTITAVVEYDADPNNYPEDKRTPEGMLEIDLAGADDDTIGFISGDNVKWSISGEVIK